MMWLEYLGLFLVSALMLDASRVITARQRGVPVDVALNGTFQVGIRTVFDGRPRPTRVTEKNERRQDEFTNSTTRAVALSKSRRLLRNNRRNGREASEGVRHKRHNRPTSQQSQLCQRYDLFVDVARLGWADTVVYPRRFNIHYCAGRCLLVVRASGIDISNHATLRAIMRGHRRRHPAPPPAPCCVATSLRPMNLLYRDKQRGHYNIRQLNDVIVDTCGCR